MLYDPRDLTQELEDQGNAVHLEKDEYGDPIYRIILADGKLYRLSAQEMYDLKDKGTRCPMQDSRPGWIRCFLSCRALASPTTCRFIPAYGVLSPILP
jgi:hypothetical protein